MERAFGAYVTMRDEPMHTPGPEHFQSDTWHEEWIAEAGKAIQRPATMSEQEILDEIQKER